MLAGALIHGKKGDAPKALLHTGTEPDDQVCAAELLTETPVDRREDTVKALKRDRSPKEVRRAMSERIARVPLSDLEKLKHIYLKRCGDATE
jgi:hypothetical protein